jgi:hypothetical protein
MSLTVRVERSEGRPAMSLAALAASLTQCVQRAIEAGVEPDEIVPRVYITPRGKIKKIEVTIP